MSNSLSADLTAVSDAWVDLVSRAATGVVAVKAAPYRTVSGVSLSENLIAVCHHTLRREDHIPVRTADGTEAVAAILGRDESIDVAVLKADGLPLNPLPVCEPSTLRAGTLAAVIGMTSDVGASTSLGLLGAVGPARRTWRGGLLDQFLRLDVNLYPSQSGAAVVNTAGQLIGLATPALSRHAAIAVPVATLSRVAEELIKEGRIRHGYLGVGLQRVAIQPTVAARLQITPRSGLIVLSVEADSPAEKGSLQVGDVLLELNGHSLDDVDDLQAALRGDAVGKTLETTILRGGQIEKVAVTITERTGRRR